jgi:hypothetical protein
LLSSHTKEGPPLAGVCLYASGEQKVGCDLGLDVKTHVGGVSASVAFQGRGFTRLLPSVTHCRYQMLLRQRDALPLGWCLVPVPHLP